MRSACSLIVIALSVAVVYSLIPAAATSAVSGSGGKGGIKTGADQHDIARGPVKQLPDRSG